MGKALNRDGETSGSLTIVTTHYDKDSQGKDTLCLVKCQCGTTKTVRLPLFKRTKSCGDGCPYKVIERDHEDMSGKTSNFLEVLGWAGKTKNNIQLFECLCLLCQSTCKVRSTRIKTGETLSCGCYKEAIMKAGLTNRRHGFSPKGNEDPVYKRLCKIIKRCNDPSDHHYMTYGSRGIYLWEHWNGLDYDSISAFRNYLIEINPDAIELLKSGYEIDRINSNSSYIPGNLRIVTPEENNWNRRMVTKFEVNGSCISLRQIFRESQSNRSFYQVRTKFVRGATLEESLGCPIPEEKYVGAILS